MFDNSPKNRCSGITTAGSPGVAASPRWTDRSRVVAQYSPTASGDHSDRPSASCVLSNNRIGSSAHRAASSSARAGTSASNRDATSCSDSPANSATARATLRSPPTRSCPPDELHIRVQPAMRVEGPSISQRRGPTDPFRTLWREDWPRTLGTLCKRIAYVD
jgi:hypothetical protein